MTRTIAAIALTFALAACDGSIGVSTPDQCMRAALFSACKRYAVFWRVGRTGSAMDGLAPHDASTRLDEGGSQWQQHLKAESKPQYANY